MFTNHLLEQLYLTQPRLKCKERKTSVCCEDASSPENIPKKLGNKQCAIHVTEGVDIRLESYAFELKKYQDISPFCGATDIPV